ncbi:hypothetical protein ACF1B6_15710 [Streptomyces flaveolus]|uniref:hypothetical protein n=1 Tax=Streptomyces flaveolus TaxID=67297 RepID=UPI0036F92E6B
MPSTQHITTREAIHHDDPTEQHLLKHGSAGRREVVLGVDTHGEVHVAAVISLLGKVLATESFPATAAGYRQLLVWARKRGTVHRAGSRPAPRRSTSSRPSWSSPTPLCGNE